MKIRLHGKQASIGYWFYGVMCFVFAGVFYSVSGLGIGSIIFLGLAVFFFIKGINILRSNSD